ncbi:hypothetical protein HJG53_07825 [Sphingomonas sp. ID1715]|uniref:hypothetical protein n=1 Tax=Sphingomonas sp. ID1715 TaxID=1656898 RepID=UPI0014876524|nr:hypothetical protein [Sphingomonas sp. ID1715]NNM76804.1 hypothetical protein [Sphingomonas sp. ID1715]
MNIDTEFAAVEEALELNRAKLKPKDLAQLMELSARAKALFLADPEDTNGKTSEGLGLLWDMVDILDAARRRRVVKGVPDEEGEVTGD